MNILFCGDSGVCTGIYLSVLSLCKQASEPLHIYILTAEVGTRAAVSEEFSEALARAPRVRETGTQITRIDATAVFCASPPTANLETRFTPLCMLRLYADLFPEIPDRLLYLDTDVLCRADFADFYRTDMQGAELLGVPDRYGKWFFGNILRHDYLNSGVLLMDMARIRESGLFARCRQLCREEKMFMPDQSALNRLAVKQKAPVRYNEQGRIHPDTVFKHFTTFFRFFPYFRAVTVKPWQPDRLHDVLHIYEFDGLLEEYQRSYQNG